MSVALRAFLLIGALVTTLYVFRKIRRSTLQIQDAIFWIFFSLGLLVLSIFPGITFIASDLLRIQSPINFVFLCMIFILLVKIFTLSLQISQLQDTTRQLVQELALQKKQREEETLQDPKHPEKPE